MYKLIIAITLDPAPELRPACAQVPCAAAPQGDFAQIPLLVQTI